MRVTLKMLQNRVVHLNKMLNRPETYFEGVEGNKRLINVGHFHIDCAYGGYQLAETCNTSGGSINVFNRGYIPARELLELIHAFEIGFAAQYYQSTRGA